MSQEMPFLRVCEGDYRRGKVKSRPERTTQDTPSTRGRRARSIIAHLGEMKKPPKGLNYVYINAVILTISPYPSATFFDHAASLYVSVVQVLYPFLPHISTL